MRTSIKVGLVASFALVVGFLLGAGFSNRADSTDVANTLRAADFNNRLTMLRVFRMKAPHADEIPSMEISAIVVLSNIQFEKVGEQSSAATILKKSTEYIDAYRRDFPDSEFEPKKHEEVARLMSWRPGGR